MDTKYANRHLSVMELEQTFGNIRSIHRNRKMTITQLSDYKRIFQEYGFEGLKDLQPIEDINNSITPQVTDEMILALSYENPSCGNLMLSNMFALQGFGVSPAAIQSVFNKNGMTCGYDRILKLEGKAIRENIVLTDKQIALIEQTNPCFTERNNESSRPGEVLAQDTIYLGTYRMGKIYLQAVVDTYGSYAFGFLHSCKAPEYAVAVLHNAVIPFYREKGLAVDTILTDSGREYCGRETHPFELYLALNNIEHKNNKEHRSNKESGHGQTNGFLERFKKTALKEFFQKILKGSYKDIKNLQADFDNWLVYYNNERPHRGYRNLGQCPVDTINKYMALISGNSTSPE
jgi:hypothetical protein